MASNDRLLFERAYCRFLYPLGSVLAILDRLRLINLLKRRPEYGNPCHFVGIVDEV